MYASGRATQLGRSLPPTPPPMFKLFKSNKKTAGEAVASPAVVQGVEGSAMSQRYVYDEARLPADSSKHIVLRCAASYLPHPDKVSGGVCEQGESRKSKHIETWVCLCHCSLC